MKSKIDRMDVAQTVELIAAGVIIVNNWWVHSKVLAIAGVCLASAGITLAVEDIVLYYKGES